MSMFLIMLGVGALMLFGAMVAIWKFLLDLAAAEEELDHLGQLEDEEFLRNLSDQ